MDNKQATLPEVETLQTVLVQIIQSLCHGIVISKNEQNSLNKKTSKNSGRHKPPSRKLRNAKRAEDYRKKLQTLKPQTADAATQTDMHLTAVIQESTVSTTGQMYRHRQGLGWKKHNVNKDKITNIGNKNKIRENQPQTKPIQFIKTSVLIPNKPNNQPGESLVQSSETSKNLNLMYEDFEINLRISRLEDCKNLGLALRHIIRNKHPKGVSITFPQPEAIDRILLKSANLPTELNALSELVENVYKRRNEKLNIEEVYRQFVQAHGRIVLDPKQKWPHSHVHTYQP